MTAVIVLNVIVLPVQAASTPAGEWTDDEYHEEYEDLSDCPKYSKEDLVYTGELSQNVQTDFNLLKQYGMNWCKDTGFYMSRPFEFRYRWDQTTNTILNFGKTTESAYHKMFTEEKFHSLFDTYFANNELSLDDYDVYYMVRQRYHTTAEYGYLNLYYYLVPKGCRIAMSNENKPDGSSDYNKVKYGLCLDSMAFSSYIYGGCYIDGETRTVKNFNCGHLDKSFISFLGMAHNGTIATNIPIFTKQEAAENYVENGSITEDPSNKVPDDSSSDSNNKMSADAFGWDSFKCRLVHDGNSYKFVYDYKYSNADMVANPLAFYMDIDYSQIIRYRNRVNSGIYQDATVNKESQLDINSAGTSTDSLSVIDTSGNFGENFIYYLCLLIDEASSFFGGDSKLTDVDVHSSSIYVTVTLKHKRYSTGNPAIDTVSKVLSDVSSDVRTFKFDALTLESLDNPEEIASEVITKDTMDANGNVTGKEVTQIITNDNSTHTTIYNYYYDSDGNKSTSPNGSSSGSTLSDILSGLIDFIKTLVTKGLPAALEILTTLVSSVSGIVSDALNNIDIGTGTSNGILAVFKAFPAAMWSLLLIGILVLVVVGIINRIF